MDKSTPGNLVAETTRFQFDAALRLGFCKGPVLPNRDLKATSRRTTWLSGTVQQKLGLAIYAKSINLRNIIEIKW